MSIPYLLVAPLGVVTLLSLLAQSKWPFELLQHFRPHFIAAGVLGAALCLWIGSQWEWAAMSFGLALVNYAALPARAFIKPNTSLEKQPGVTIVWANVWGKQKPLERTLAWAKEQGADLILIGEFPEGDADAVMAGDYPHRLDTGPEPGKHGFETRLVALSRAPLEDGEVRAGPGQHHRPWLTFAIGLGGERLNILAAHPTPPNTAQLLKERDDHIAMLAPLAREPFVIAADFNATPWCPAYASIPGRRVGGYLFKPTWFTDLPLIGLPIDHVLVSPSLKASLYRVAPFLGSDHRAILMRVHLPGRVGGPQRPVLEPQVTAE